MAERRRDRPERPSLIDDPERLFRVLVESVRDYAIFVLDPTGIIMTWNRGAERLKGYRGSEVIGKHFSVFYPPEDVVAGKPAFELVVAEQEGLFEDEGWRIKEDGTRFWANVVITALRDETGELAGFGKVTRDLTDRRRAEEGLRASEERFRLLVHDILDYGIIMLDPKGRVASWNEGARRITGWREDEVLGRPLSVFYPAEDQKSGKPEREIEVAEREGRYSEEGWRIRKDGGRFWASVAVTALRAPHGRLIGFAKVTRDLTERRAAEERAIADARRLAEWGATNRAKSEFLAALSHELRTPLNAIGGYADILTLGIHGPVTELQAEDLRRIKRSQRHLLSIINDLLNYTRIEAGKLAYDLRPVSLAETIDSVQPMIEPQAAAKGVHVEWPVPDRGVVARADPLKLEQIVLNLLTNAVKFTDREGRIDVRYANDGERVVMSVTDNGVGVAAERLTDIFEPFVQVGRTLSTPQQGVGLGLSISRDLAQAMGGTLSVTSTLGVGSEFTLGLPRPPAEHES